MILELETRDFLEIILRFWPFEPNFLIGFLLTNNLLKAIIIFNAHTIYFHI